MFVKRVLSSVILVVLTLATVFAGRWILAVTLGIIALIGLFELSKVTAVHEEDKKINLPEAAAYLGTIVYYCLMFVYNDLNILFAVLAGTMILIMFFYVFLFPKYNAKQMMSLGFSFIYCPVMLSFIYMTRQTTHGIYLVWLIYISSWISDTFAYLVGISIGKHKYLPKLSPKKSLEGSIGGIAGAALISGLYGYFVLRNIIPEVNITLLLAIMGAIGSVISQIGDLAASAIKRDYGIKDYGNLIPGHGGIMDRFDSVIFTAPIIFFLTYFWIG